MNDVLSKYINTAIEILIFSILLTIIALFAGVARDALDTKVENNVIMGEMVEYRAIYKYSELVNENKKVSGDDIVTFVTEFKRKYDIEIRNTKGTRYLNKTDVDSSLWEIDKVLEFLGSTITEEYSIDMIYDEDRDIIDKFVFTY